jgi:hypothetical protein
MLLTLKQWEARTLMKMPCTSTEHFTQMAYNVQTSGSSTKKISSQRLWQNDDCHGKTHKPSRCPHKSLLNYTHGSGHPDLIKEFTLAQVPQQSTSDGTVMDTHSQRHLKLFQTLLFIYEYIWSTWLKPNIVFSLKQIPTNNSNLNCSHMNM